MKKLITLFYVMLLALFPFKGRAQRAIEQSNEHSILMEMPPIERAAFLIRHFEGWHVNKGKYIGWGHRLQPGEKLTQNITREQGDSLLYEDLRKLFNYFKGYGDYALCLTVLSYNVGPGAILGNKTRKPSRLIQKIRQGRKDIEEEYLSFCRWNGRAIPAIRYRRIIELKYLSP